MVKTLGKGITQGRYAIRIKEVPSLKQGVLTMAHIGLEKT